MRVALIVCCVALLAGCGGSEPARDDGGDAGGLVRQSEQPASGRPAKAEKAATDLGFPGLATKNTTRVAGADPVANAAGVARAVYPGVAADSRPGAVVVVDAADFQAAVSAGQLTAAPLRAPVLYSQDGKLPRASADALKAMQPAGAPQAGKAQVVRVGDGAAKPSGLRATDVKGTDAATVARGIDRLATAAAGGEPSQAVIVAGKSQPAFAMPAAGLAAKTGAPVLWVDKAIPAPTRAAIMARKRPRIYIVGPAKAVSAKVATDLGKLGRVQRISGADPVANAVAVARYADGAFGWNVVDPGHGIVFAAADRPGEAGAAVALSGSGSYGPLLLVDEAQTLPKAVEGFLLDIQPGYDKDPVRGVYNHGWLLGNEKAISVDVQARIDSLMEIQPVSG